MSQPSPEKIERSTKPCFNSNLLQHQGVVEKEKSKLIEIEKKVNEIKKQIDKCPESMRGSMEEKLNNVRNYFSI